MWQVLEKCEIERHFPCVLFTQGSTKYINSLNSHVAHMPNFACSKFTNNEGIWVQRSTAIVKTLAFWLARERGRIYGSGSMVWSIPWRCITTKQENGQYGLKVFTMCTTLLKATVEKIIERVATSDFRCEREFPRYRIVHKLC